MNERDLFGNANHEFRCRLLLSFASVYWSSLSLSMCILLVGKIP